MFVLLRSTGSRCVVLSTRLTVVALSNYSSFIVVFSCCHVLRLTRGGDSVLLSFRLSVMGRCPFDTGCASSLFATCERSGIFVVLKHLAGNFK